MMEKWKVSHSWKPARTSLFMITSSSSSSSLSGGRREPTWEISIRHASFILIIVIHVFVTFVIFIK